MKVRGGKRFGRIGIGGRKGALFALLAVAGCAVPADQAGEPERQLPAADVPPRQAAAPERPATLDDSLSIEGMREPMRFVLYRSPDAGVLTFSTYLPEDIRPAEAGAGEVARFVPHFGGAPTEGAWIAFTALESGVDAAEAQRRVRSLAESLGPARLVEGEGQPWALHEYMLDGDSFGSVALGRHGGAYFILSTRYPPEMGDGFGARRARILHEWRWADGGRLGS